jgi:ribosomal protein S18 acetylase RimI-like enzyme
MIAMNFLDNPVWYALLQSHKAFALQYGNCKFYDPSFCPFGAFDGPPDIEESLAAYSIVCPDFYIVGEKPLLPSSVALKNELICLQYIINESIENEATSAEPILLNGIYEKELINLVNLVQPGFFKSKTSLLGKYYGIFADDKLVAVTGERMQLDGFTEVSAVVTHPDYTGKGFAKNLVAHTVNQIIAQHKLAFLHVNQNNQAAIRLYERLGFVMRRKISFWHLVRNGG